MSPFYYSSDDDDDDDSFYSSDDDDDDDDEPKINLYKDRYKNDGITLKTEINFKPSKQINNFIPSISKGSSGIVESGCTVYNGYEKYACANTDSKFEVKSKGKIETNMSEMEWGGSCDIGIFEQEAKMGHKSSIQ